MADINFFFEETEPIALDTDFLSSWICEVFTKENKPLDSINYIICSDEYLYKINLDYLQHDYYTDVITFDNSEPLGAVEGDIYMSIDRIKDNACANGDAVVDELKRIMVHGALHLIGYDDKSPELKTIMTQKENAYLSLPKYRTT